MIGWLARLAMPQAQNKDCYGWDGRSGQSAMRAGKL
jgi:hypothetical protein